MNASIGQKVTDVTESAIEQRFDGGITEVCFNATALGFSDRDRSLQYRADPILHTI